jgi:hypothetical protein
MRRSAVSSVNTIRQEMGEATPFIAIPNRVFAGRESGSSDSDDPLAVENIGGPVGLRYEACSKEKTAEKLADFHLHLVESASVQFQALNLSCGPFACRSKEPAKGVDRVRYCFLQPPKRLWLRLGTGEEWVGGYGDFEH